MARPTIVLGAAGTGTSFALASRLRANWGDDIRLVGLDIWDPKLVATALLCDEFYIVPHAGTQGYYETVADIISSECATTFVPILNEEIAQANEISSRAASNYLDIWNNPDFFSLTDKIRAEHWLATVGVASPYRPNASELELSSDEWFVKPRDGLGSRNISKLTGTEIVKRGLLDAFIVQEICDGPEVTVDSFFDFETDTGLSVCRERLETKSGVCTKARVFFDEELATIARRIALGLGQRGTLCFQVMRANAKWVVTDLNLRSGAGTALSCAAGYDVLSAAYACRSGQDYSRYLGDPVAGDIYVTRQYAEFVTARS